MMVRRIVSWCGALTIPLTVTACINSAEPSFQGWMEADYIFVAPDETGRVETLSVREGETVTAGQPLFTVEDDLQKADVQQSQAALTNAQQAFERADKLLKTGSGSQMAYDNAQAALREAEARLNSAQTRLARRKIASPVTGTVEQIYYRRGEMAPAGRPVVSLLPPGNLKARFFVPEAMLPKIGYGQRVKIKCEGCPEASAAISYIAKNVEYTPPVIYSLDERSKLVFMVEARPDNPDGLRVGQPLSVVMTAMQEAKR